MNVNETPTHNETRDMDEVVELGSGDDMVEDWSSELAVVEEIRWILAEAEDEGLEVPWEDLLADGRLVSEVPRRGFYQVEDLLGAVPEVNVAHEHWGGESPGLSGVWITVTTRRKDLPSLRARLEALRERLEDWWRDTREDDSLWTEEEARQWAEEAQRRREKEEQARKEQQRAERAREQEAKHEAEANLIVRWLTGVLDRPDRQPCSYFSLLVFEGAVLWIRAVPYRFSDLEPIDRAVATLKSRGVHVVEVHQEYAGSHIPYFAGPKRQHVMGWHCATSPLTAALPGTQELVSRAHRAWVERTGGRPTDEWVAAFGCGRDGTTLLEDRLRALDG
jgi:hypothetical protein